MFDESTPREEHNPQPIGKLKQVIVRLTHNGVITDYTFQVSPTTETAIVELDLDHGAEGLRNE